VPDGSGIAYRGVDLCCDEVPLAELAATYGTPTYVYSATTMLERFDDLRRALAAVPHLVCYAIKTNSNLGVIGTLARAGAGFDIVSAGELHRLRRVGAPPERIVFAGVGKTADEMRLALEAGIGVFNVESLPEAELLSEVARESGRTARVALRVNPDLAAGAHRYIATGTSEEKFGVPRRDAVETFRRAHLARGLFNKRTDSKHFLVVDAGMNDLVRPSLYGAHHEILPLRRVPDRGTSPVDVVGPLCESGDFLARERPLPGLEPGEWLAVCSAGAYGFAMSSNYNSRPRAAEVLVRGREHRLVRRRETLDDLVRGECDWSPT
jgi:diaminopimelate decarboxylase